MAPERSASYRNATGSLESGSARELGDRPEGSSRAPEIGVAVASEGMLRGSVIPQSHASLEQRSSPPPFSTVQLHASLAVFSVLGFGARVLCDRIAPHSTFESFGNFYSSVVGSFSPAVLTARPTASLGQSSPSPTDKGRVLRVRGRRGDPAEDRAVFVAAVRRAVHRLLRLCDLVWVRYCFPGPLHAITGAARLYPRNAPNCAQNDIDRTVENITIHEPVQIMDDRRYSHRDRMGG